MTQDVDFQALITETIQATSRRYRHRRSEGAQAAEPGEGSRQPRRARRRVAGLLLTRPRLLTRIVLLGVLVLLAALAVMAAFTAQAVGGLVEALREDHSSRRQLVLEEPLPPDDELLAAERFALWLERRPRQATALHRRRAELLLAAGQAEAALAHFRESRLISPVAPTFDQRLSEARALLASGRRAEAGRRLEALARAAANAEQRAAVLAELGRLYAAEALSDPR